MKLPGAAEIFSGSEGTRVRCIEDCRQQFVDFRKFKDEWKRKRLQQLDFSATVLGALLLFVTGESICGLCLTK